MISGWVGIRQDHDKRGKIASSGRHPWWSRRAKRGQNSLGIAVHAEEARAVASKNERLAASRDKRRLLVLLRYGELPDPRANLTLAPTRAGITPMPDMSRRALIKATGMVSASMALSSSDASAQ